MHVGFWLPITCAANDQYPLRVEMAERHDDRSAVFTRHYLFGVVADLLNSECSQQNRANENKHGTYRQHIERQGTVIGLDDAEHSSRHCPNYQRKLSTSG